MVKWLKLFRDHDFINISWLIWVFSWNWWALGERKKKTDFLEWEGGKEWF
jgi:hypothetical protein